MGKYNSPGVYSKVTNRSQIASLATDTVFASVFQATRGPKGPRYISDSRELLNLYGNPDQGRALGLWGALEVTKQRGALWVNNISAGDDTTGYLTFEVGEEEPIVGAILDPSGVAFATDDLFRVAAIGPGTFYHGVGVKVLAADATTGLVTLGVYTSSNPNSPVETFTFTLTAGLSPGGVQRFAEDVINGNSMYIVIEVKPTYTTGLPTVSTDIHYFAGASYGAAADAADTVAGWDVFKNTKKYDITVLINGGFADAAVHAGMIEVATYRGDCIALLDLPASALAATAAVTYREDTLLAYSRFGMLLGPRYKIYSPYEDRNIFVPASGGVAAAVAYSDSVKDIWWAFAGQQRGKIPGAVGLEAEWEQADLDLLYPKSINALVNEPGVGVMLLGNRTLLEDDSALWSANVHRLVCALVKSCSGFLKGQLMEQNDDVLGRSIEVALSDICDTVKAGRGLYKYLVQSNAVTTDTDIDNLTRNVEVNIQPTRAAEIIVLNVVLTRTGAEFTVSSITNQSL